MSETGDGHCSSGEQQEMCKHCDEPVTDSNETCLDCYVLAHAVNAGFPV